MSRKRTNRTNSRSDERCLHCGGVTREQSIRNLGRFMRDTMVGQDRAFHHLSEPSCPPDAMPAYGVCSVLPSCDLEIIQLAGLIHREPFDERDERFDDRFDIGALARQITKVAALTEQHKQAFLTLDLGLESALAFVPTVSEAEYIQLWERA